eukprot:TRINITY_DN92177_c0_g1_i1.p1 TRINITY_DN92177_c0_g1~~TRINITY_DN92177_c0_g1_i1.p1  ORF type:complete len:121 (+),score=23.92 TRINITY_DN92177_c0_g1_i1:38-400(+)
MRKAKVQHSTERHYKTECLEILDGLLFKLWLFMSTGIYHQCSIGKTIEKHVCAIFAALIMRQNDQQISGPAPNFAEYPSNITVTPSQQLRDTFALYQASGFARIAKADGTSGGALESTFG